MFCFKIYTEYIKVIDNTIENEISQYATLPYDRKNLTEIRTNNIHFTITDQLFLDLNGNTKASMKQKKTAEEKLEEDIKKLEKCDKMDF